MAGRQGQILEKESSKTVVVPHGIITSLRLGFLLMASTLVFVLALVLAGIVLFLGYVFSGGNLESSPSIITGAAVVVLVILTVFAIGLIESLQFRENFRFSLEPEFVFSRQGTIGPGYTLIPYENIQDVSLNQGFFERISGTGTLLISTPATATSVPFVPLRDAEELKKKILGLSEKHKGRAE